MNARSTAAKVNPFAVSNTGTLDYYEGDYAAAAARFREAIALRERDFISWRNLGDAYRQIEGHDGDARAAYERSVELAQDERRVNPSDVVTLHNLAFVYAVLGRTGEAVVIVDQLEPDAGDDPDMMVSLAQTLEQVGERDRALGWIREALARDYSLKIIESEPQLAGLRSDPRFASIRREAMER